MTKSENIQRNMFETLFPLGGFKLEPELKLIDQILTEDDSILQEVVLVLNKRRRFSKTLGRQSTAADSVLRLLIVRRLYDWSLRFTIERVKDSIGLRYFTRLYLEDVPDYSVLARYEQLIPPETLEKINQIIVDNARKRKVTKGRKLRVDTTVVETNIHYPTDSGLLTDGVRVLGRLSQKIKKAGLATGKAVRDFSRSAKRVAFKVAKLSRGKSQSAKKSFKKSYQKLIGIAKQAVRRAKTLKDTVIDKGTQLGGESLKIAQTVKEQLDHYLPLIEKVISQSVRRIVKEEVVPNIEKIISLFQPHSYVIRKGKTHKPNEFGQMVKIQEADGGIISDWQSCHSGLHDSDLFIPSVQKHIQLFGRPPHLVAADRAFYSQTNEQTAYQMGVKRVSMPKKGRISKERQKLQHSRWFKQGQRFRAGCEGRISVLKRRLGFNRCLNKGQKGYDQWIGWAVIASNLKVMANA